jgi:hypothetical protein
MSSKKGIGGSFAIYLILGILLAVIMYYAVISMIPKAGEQVVNILPSLSNKCSLPKSDCANCLSFISANPAAVELKNPNDWQKSDCAVNTDKISLTFNDKVNRNSPDSIQLMYACGRIPSTKEEWDQSSDSSSISIRESSVDIRLNPNCYYRIRFTDKFLGESGNAINQVQSVIAFKQGAKA